MSESNIQITAGKITQVLSDAEIADIAGKSAMHHHAFARGIEKAVMLKMQNETDSAIRETAQIKEAYHTTVDAARRAGWIVLKQAPSSPGEYRAISNAVAQQITDFHQRMQADANTSVATAWLAVLDVIKKLDPEFQTARDKAPGVVLTQYVVSWIAQQHQKGAQVLELQTKLNQIGLALKLDIGEDVVEAGMSRIERLYRIERYSDKLVNYVIDKLAPPTVDAHQPFMKIAFKAVADAADALAEKARSTELFKEVMARLHPYSEPYETDNAHSQAIASVVGSAKRIDDLEAMRAGFAARGLNAETLKRASWFNEIVAHINDHLVEFKPLFDDKDRDVVFGVFETMQHRIDQMRKDIKEVSDALETGLPDAHGFAVFAMRKVRELQAKAREKHNLAGVVFEQSPNTINIQGYSASGELIGMSTRSSIQVHHDMQLMDAILMFDNAVDRGVEIKAHKVGNLFISSIDPEKNRTLGVNFGV